VTPDARWQGVNLVLTFNSIFNLIRDTATNHTFGQRTRELRKAKNFTQRELAERVSARLKEEDRCGFDVTYLSKIENGKIPPPSTIAILQLTKELDAHSDELLALAGKAPMDLGQTLKESEGARLFYRSAQNMNLSDDDWKEMLEYLRQRRATK
jgi:transcriptional regulator with XRE-family HTH domain